MKVQTLKSEKQIEIDLLQELQQFSNWLKDTLQAIHAWSKVQSRWIQLE